MGLTQFEIDERLARDSRHLVDLDLCELRLMEDCRWPWLLLVPRRDGIEEVYELRPEDQALFFAETVRIAEVLNDVTGADKINIGALGNHVRQLHMHVIARLETDAAWPNPVWGVGAAEPWDEAERERFVFRLMERLS
ncbi:diadenosine tetraphosphate hydrolase [Rhizobium rhizosphaerae]|uniref:Diadenosine tetraphosphate hydrolase n=1 Tax=Xaviernesmea rhizosphaerae TaxID=1672749 RepID=A0ABX3PAW1_9HYPH|nr:diadenosine tetraphosphate hydrolase [Xaviernesmea rhizosphaerae]